MNDVTQIDVIRQDANASHYELLINRANSERKCSKLILDFHQLSLRKAEEFVRSRFWLGGAVHKAHSLAKHGEGVMAKLCRETGVSESVLSGCMKLYDLCSGKVEKLQGIIDNVLESRGKIGWGDVETILRVNSEIVKQNRERRVLRDRITEIKQETPGAVVMPSIANRLTELEDVAETAPIVIPDLADQPVSSRITRRRTIRSIASACNVLADDDSEPVTIQEIEIEGRGTFEVLVTLLPVAIS